MDRLKLTLAGCGLVALLTAPGCRNLRSEVPAGRPYSSDGRQMPAVGFSSDPHPMVGGAATPLPGTPGAGPTEPSSMPAQLGTPAPGSNGNNYGAPTNNAYGPPGTSPLGAAPSAAAGTGAGLGAGGGMPPAMDPAASPASSVPPSFGVDQPAPPGAR